MKNIELWKLSPGSTLYRKAVYSFFLVKSKDLDNPSLGHLNIFQLKFCRELFKRKLTVMLIENDEMIQIVI